MAIKMTEILTLLSMVVSILLSPVLIIYSLRCHLRIRLGGVWCSFGMAAFGFGALLICHPVLLQNISVGMAAMAAALVLMYSLAFLFLRDCVPQLLYAIFFYVGVGGIAVSIGNYIEVVSALPASTAPLARIFLTLFGCMAAFTIQRRLFSLWEKNGSRFWQAVWLIPFSLVILALFSGNVWTIKPGSHSLAFLAARLVGIVALFAITLLLEHVLRQERYYHSMADWGKQLSVYGNIQDSVLLKLSDIWEETAINHRQLCEIVKQVKAYGAADDFAAISRMLSENIENMHENKSISWCRNPALNALAGWYYEIAKEKSIKITLRLDIPEQPGMIKNVDLCRIVGNMLENAVEACRQVEPEKREIIFSSMVAGRMLVLVMDNSFDGNIYRRGEQYLSRKRENGLATGLSSIAAVAKDYHGCVSLKEEGKIFKTSVRLDMGTEVKI